MKPITKYILAYAGYCVGIDIIDRNTNILQKQTGFYAKSESFPFFDAWTVTHIAWGMIAKKMNLKLMTYATLSVLNEVFLEQIICKYAENNPYIHFSKKCDSPPHMIADIIYGLVGYFLIPTENFKLS